MRRNQLIIAVLASVGVLLIAWFVIGMTRGTGNEDRLSDDQLNRSSTPEPEERCSSQRAYDLVKRELFRQAAAARGSDASAFNSLSAYAAIRVDAPVLKRNDEELGTVVCSGRVAVDLPPGVAVIGGRRTLIADLDYAIQPAADGNGDVVTLSGADGIVVPLATLARTGSQPTSPGQAEEQPPLDADEAAPDLIVPSAPSPPRPPEPRPTIEPGPSEPAPVQERTARPSFNCRYARTRSEIAVCNDAGLASLDRQMASQYVRAVQAADPEQQRLLQQTRLRFLRYRDGCRSNDCVADAYRGRIQEIRDIVSGEWRGPR